MAGRILKSCEICGEQYSVRPDRAQSAKYCGIECRGMARRIPVEARFWGYVQKAGESECWPWSGAKRGAYGCILVDGSAKPAHRIAYELSKGAIPDGMEIRHSCDNPPCCNPAHLSYGTHSDNMRDMRDRKRGAWQVLHPEDIEVIRSRYIDQHIPQRRIAKELGLSVSAVSKAIRGQNWAGTGAPKDAVLKTAAAGTRAIRRGVDAKNAKLTAEIVRAMRAEYAAGNKQVDIAAKYGISKMAASQAIRGKRWAHVE